MIINLHDNNIIAIIPAAGIGKRMLYHYPKQYIMIKNKTIIEHSIECLLKHENIKYVIVVIRQDDIYFNKLNIAKHPKIITTIGGKNRSDSVLNGLKIINKNTKWVLIHDAVRPCLYYQDLLKLCSIIKQKNIIGGILAKPVKNTIKYIKHNDIINYTLNRKNLWNALTPQIFLTKLLFSCLQYVIYKKIIITDDSSCLEYCGYHPKIIIGRNDNIKITTPEDLIVAKLYIKNLKNL